ncbi:MAG: GTP-binding protein, partial [Leptolyngbyaceae cyanobacterium RM2_2_4]|nr:GTP-binding protein [Leptolyngbyaceae cyanobacterium RM2_2_4]
MTQEELLALIDQAAAEGWTELDLSGQGLTELPGAIIQLTHLKKLDLSHNQISEVPAAIAHLTTLTELNLSGNQITQISEAITQLINLTALDLGFNQISEIPVAIAQLTNLTDLSLHSNQIARIPEVIAQCNNLTDLYLYGNRITEIPTAIAHLTRLTMLYLSDNRIIEIPAAITYLTNLTGLYLSLNQITQIPAAIAKLTNLTELSLWGNRISEIPTAIAELTNLEELNLSKNQLSEIPMAIVHITSLQTLNFQDNKIKTLPNWLEALPKLETLDLRGNPLPISPEILDSPDSVEDIFNYCHQLRSGKVRPLNEAKLLLVGQGSVGKTSLIKRLIDNQFDRHQPQTDGLNVRTWNVHVNSKDVRLNVWDFGGQEIYHATHQFFLTKRSLYLLVCNCRTSEDENRIEYWLKLIESFGGESPVIIIGNKNDEQPLDINRKALREKYPNIKAILETSCQTSDGIDDLRAAIVREVGLLSDVYNLLPLSWFEVKEQLEAMDRDFISYSEYIGIC